VEWRGGGGVVGDLAAARCVWNCVVFVVTKAACVKICTGGP